MQLVMADLFDEEPVEEREPAFYTVALAYHDRAYGGPEEGGWYFDTYTPATERLAPSLDDKWDLPRTFRRLDDACSWAECLLHMIKECNANEGRYRAGSVLSRGDWLTAYVFDEFPCILPKERPHYE